jgi:outer membrane immunogenic protein
MKSNRLSFITGLALAGIAAATSTSALASGPRIEAHGGWDRIDTTDGRDNGVLYGIGLGYDFDIAKNVFAGVEANADFSTAKECESGAIVAGDTLCVKASRDLSLIARAGVEVASGSKLYALGGWTNARFRATYTSPAGDLTRDGQNVDGWRVGAGFQQDLGQGLHAKLEYRYSDYGDNDRRHQVVAGFGLTF